MKRTLLAAIVAACACFAVASTAQGAYDPLGGGTAKLSLDKRFVSFLKPEAPLTRFPSDRFRVALTNPPGLLASRPNKVFPSRV